MNRNTGVSEFNGGGICFPRKRLVVLGLVLASLAAILAMGSTNTKAPPKDPAAGIKTVHETLVGSGLRNGKWRTGPTTNIWIKFPEKRRIEWGDKALQITNASGRWEYSQPLNIYTFDKYGPTTRASFSKDDFILSVKKRRWIEGYKRFREPQVREMRATFEEVEYPAVEIIVFLQGVIPEGTMGAHRRITLYEYPGTGLLRAMVDETIAPDGKVVLKEEHEYEYNKGDLADDFFVFTPPPGAVKKDILSKDAPPSTK